MNCTEALTLVEEYFDGELERQEAARVAAHLAACDACAAARDALAREQEFYLAAAPDAELAPDFWQKVVARTREEAAPARPEDTRPAHAPARRSLRAWLLDTLRAPRFSPALTAAAVLLAVGLTALFMKYRDARHAEPPRTVATAGTPDSAPSPAATSGGEQHQREETAQTNNSGSQQQPTPPAPAVPKRAAASSSSVATVAHARPRPETREAAEPTADELVREAERKYVAAIALLSRDVRRRRPALDPADAARFERALATVDRAIDDARRATRRRPEDPVAAQYMLAAYARKVDLLRELAAH